VRAATGDVVPPQAEADLADRAGSTDRGADLDATVTLAVSAAAVTVVLIISLRFGHRIEAFLHSPSEEVFLLESFSSFRAPSARGGRGS
jgi:hypothetical protein